MTEPAVSEPGGGPTSPGSGTDRLARGARRVSALTMLSRLLGLVLNAALGWWWADPAAGYVLVFYAAREVGEIFLAS